jgi:hypothetical protein
VLIKTCPPGTAKAVEVGILDNVELKEDCRIANGRQQGVGHTRADWFIESDVVG